jgi:hypothetical protein
MAIPFPDLSTLNPEDVQQTIDYLTQRLGEYDPTINNRRGVVQEILVQLAGVLSAADAQIIEEQVNKSGSLLAITADPAGADPDMVDRLISNFRVTRRPGGRAQGQVTVVLSKFVPTTIPNGFQFEAGGTTFVTQTAFAGRTNAASVVSDTDRLIRAVTNGYALTIDVAAQVEGSGGQLKRLAPLNPLGTIPSLVRVYAENDFVGGVDPDTNEELLSRLQEGLADRSSSNRITIDSMIRNDPTFSRTLATSAIGFGDAEQLRYHYLFPVAFGGRVDIYVQTDALPQTLKLTKAATLIDTTAQGGIWQFSLTREDAPGFYEVRKIVLAGQDDGIQEGYAVTELVHGLDLTADGTGLTPDIETVEEGAFTCFQTATVRFLDTETATEDLTINQSQADYDILVTAMAQVAELQTFMADRSRRPAAADVLVKAPVPCFLEVNFKVFKKTGQADPDLEAMKTDLAAYVSGLGFAGRLSAGALSSVAFKRLSGGQTLSAIDMFGRIVRPDGETKYIRSDEVLLIPDWPEKMVTARTTVFLLDPTNISISTVVA